MSIDAWDSVFTLRVRHEEHEAEGLEILKAQDYHLYKKEMRLPVDNKILPDENI